MKKKHIGCPYGETQNETVLGISLLFISFFFEGSVFSGSQRDALALEKVFEGGEKEN